MHTLHQIRLSLGYQALIDAILGIFAGLFFGPKCAVVKPLGDIYVMLLQMVTLPYLCFSVIHGLGSMPPTTGKALFKKGWHFLYY